MRSSRWWSLLLMPAGLALGHFMAYGAARAQGSLPSLVGGHGSVHILLLLAVPFALAMVVRVAVGARRGEPLPVRLGWLAVQQVVAYVALELVEHGAAGIGPAAALRESTVLWGIAAQLALALLMTTLARGVRVAVQRLSSRSAVRLQPRPRPRVLPGPTAGPVLLAVPVSSLSRRGPPPRSC